MERDLLLKTLRQVGGQGQAIVVPRAFVKFTGTLEAGMMLSQLLYWSERDGGRGRVYKTDREWQDELCLSRYAVRAARARLEEMGLVKTAVHRANGLTVLHYYLQEDALLEQWEAWIGRPESDNEPPVVRFQTTACSISDDRLSEIEQPLTEITTEITTEEEVRLDINRQGEGDSAIALAAIQDAQKPDTATSKPETGSCTHVPTEKHAGLEIIDSQNPDVDSPRYVLADFLNAQRRALGLRKLKRFRTPQQAQKFDAATQGVSAEQLRQVLVYGAGNGAIIDLCSAVNYIGMWARGGHWTPGARTTYPTRSSAGSSPGRSQPATASLDTDTFRARALALTRAYSQGDTEDGRNAIHPTQPQSADRGYRSGIRGDRFPDVDTG